MFLCEQEKETETSQHAHLSFYKYPTIGNKCPSVRTDGQTDTVLIERSLSTGREKSMRCRTHVKKADQIELLFSAQPSPFLGLIENTTFVHLSKKFKYLNADFL